VNFLRLLRLHYGSVSAVSAFVAFGLWPGPAAACRPFNGTHAAVADPNEVEIEFQPVGALNQDSDKSLVGPWAVLCSRRWRMDGQIQPISTSALSAYSCIGLAIAAGGVIICYFWLDQPLAFFLHRHAADKTVFVWLQRLPVAFPLLSAFVLAWCRLWTLLDRPFSPVQPVFRTVPPFAVGVVGMIAAANGVLAQSNTAALLVEAKIPLGDVRGRIDHMAADLDRRRLFVAELGNNTVGVVDVGEGKVLQVLSGMKEPQGVGYLPGTDTLYVANGGDGSLRLFQGPNYTTNGRIDFGNDADNVRVDQSNQRVVVGYGAGALAVIDGAKTNKIGEVRLPAHPEGFQLEPGAGLAYVNLPNARGIAVADLPSGKVTAIWPVGGASANFPMAINGNSNQVLAVFRNPAKLGVFDKRDGSIVRMVDTCGDADDLFVDAKRHRVYVSCGAGMIDIFDAQTYERVSRIPTVSGARTSLFVPEFDRLFLAVRAGGGNPAAIWVFGPAP
jgi:DNA-binding beta-propeller fold protein YncE